MNQIKEIEVSWEDYSQCEGRGQDFPASSFIKVRSASLTLYSTNGTVGGGGCTRGFLSISNSA